MAETKVYRNTDVEKIVAAIPRGHKHLRLALFLKDQVIVLQEATVAAIVRAYINIIAHPLRKGVVLERRNLCSKEKKPGYAEFQLIEVGGDKEARDIMNKLVG